MQKKFVGGVFALTCAALMSLPAHADRRDASSWTGKSEVGSAAEDDYDRLDGMGKSGKKVQVIEWEGNLEIHAYPAGSLKSLALKLDKKNKDKPVMVIGYRFNDNPSVELDRRAILGINLREGFKVFKDPTETEFDKIVISNNGLANPMVAFAFDPEPKALYPEGHPALAQKEADREIASQGGKAKPVEAVKDDSSSKAADDEELQESGTIRPFFEKPHHLH